MRALLLIAAILSIPGCRPNVKTSAGSVVGSTMLVMSDGVPIWISSPALAHYTHFQYGAPHPTADAIEVVVPGTGISEWITIERATGSTTLHSGAVTIGPLASGQIWKLDFDATGHLTITGVSPTAATVSPTSLPTPSPTK